MSYALVNGELIAIDEATAQAARKGLPATATLSPVPPAVSPLQARRALRREGLLDAVLALVAASEPDARDAWEYAVEFRRDDPLLRALAGQLGLTEADIDNLFRTAAAIQGSQT
jgi:hypothetical protein